MRERRRKLRAAQRLAHCLIGPTVSPNPKSSDAPPLSQAERAHRIKAQNRVRSQRARLKKKLLSPIFSIVSKQEMREKGIRSCFVLFADRHKYILHLANWEIYSSKLASIYRHGRIVEDPSGHSGPPKLPTKEDGPAGIKYTVISQDEPQSLDLERDLLHVARPHSPIIQELCTGGTPEFNYSLLANGLMLVGRGDATRSPDSFRLSFGFNEYTTPTSFGVVDRILKKNSEAFYTEVGRIAEFLCATMIHMQNESGNTTIYNHNDRDRLFAAKLRSRLGLGYNSPMRAEMIAVCLMMVHPNRPRNHLHKDKKNPETPHYNRNGAFSVVINDEAGNYYLLQVLVASRRYAVKLGKTGVC